MFLRPRGSAKRIAERLITSTAFEDTPYLAPARHALTHAQHSRHCAPYVQAAVRLCVYICSGCLCAHTMLSLCALHSHGCVYASRSTLPTSSLSSNTARPPHIHSMSITVPPTAHSTHITAHVRIALKTHVVLHYSRDASCCFSTLPSKRV